MKTSAAFWPTMLLLGVASSAFFAADRYLVQKELQGQLSDQYTQVQDSQNLAARHPKVFSQQQSQVSDLKTIVQSAGAKHGVAVVYLNETARESGDKMNERNVVVRAVNVAHPNFVRFLAEIEQLGRGAKLKDLRIKPSEERTNVYQEAEAILALRIPRK